MKKEDEIERYLESSTNQEKKLILAAKKKCAPNAKMTPIREMIYLIILRYPKGIKAYQLLEMVKEVKPLATPPTIYRVLDFLTARKIITKCHSNHTFMSITNNRSGEKVVLSCPLCKTSTIINDSQTITSLSTLFMEQGYILNKKNNSIKIICSKCQ